MVKNILSLFLIVAAILSCYAQNKQVPNTLVFGTISNNQLSKITLKSSEVEYTVNIKNNGEFKVEFYTSNYNDYMLIYGDRYLNLIINHGDRIQIETTHNDFDKRVEFSGKGADRNNTFMTLHKGADAPNFNLKDKEGNSVSLSQFKGKYILIDVWSMTCGPCRKEMPLLKEMEEKYSNSNIEIIGIALDKDFDKWRKFVERKGLKGIQLFGGEQKTSVFAKDYCLNLTGKPRFILVDTELKILDCNAKRPSEGLSETIYKLLN